MTMALVQAEAATPRAAPEVTVFDFLRKVVGDGSDGFICIAERVPSGGFKHHFFRSVRDAGCAAQRIDGSRRDAYMALASFKDSAGRTKDRVASLRALWLDVDCGDGKDYPSQLDAARALRQFIDATGLPPPMLVSSGYGLHVYWPLTAPVPIAEWLPAAHRLKELCRVHAFAADPTRTADAASVLRPIGTRNFKRPGVKLTPFRGHLILMEEGVRDAEVETPVPGAVSPADGRTGASRPHAGAAVA